MGTADGLDNLPRHGEVREVAALDLVLDPSRSWDLANEAAEAIDALWAERSATNPNFFNGDILLMCAAAISGGVLHGRYLKTDFKSFLYWRENGFPAAGVWDAFGSAIVWSADKRLMFVRQRAGNVNSGLVYPPGGFVDPRDVTPDGKVDIASSVARELCEETGLGPDVVTQKPAYILTAHGAQLSIGSVFDSALPAREMHLRIRAFLDADNDPELEDVVFLSKDDLGGRGLDGGYRFAPFAERLAATLLDRPETR